MIRLNCTFKLFLVCFCIISASCQKKNILTPKSKSDELVNKRETSSLSTTAKIIIKLDDFGSTSTSSFPKAVLDTLKKRKLKASIGIIAKNLTDATAFANYSPYINAVDDLNHKLFEIWNHGYDHYEATPPATETEFFGTSYSYQLEHFNNATQRVLSLLGVQMHTFGAAGNKVDANTYTVLANSSSNYKVVMLSPKSALTPNIKYLNNRVNMEVSTGNVSYSAFVTNYSNATYADYMVLQGHPYLWDASDKSQFYQILTFLQGKGNEFVLPYEYYLSLQ